MALGVVLAFAAVTSSAQAITYAPLDAPGPKLSIDPATLAASVVCTDDVKGATRDPVLLLPATAVNSEQNYSYNYEKLFRAQGIPFCTSDQPGALASNMDDIQTRAEYVTYAIRRVHELSGRKIAILGHSQGGMVMRWSLRFWPDTRAMVADVIGMAGSNHGTTGANTLCAATCQAGVFQQEANSNFIKALNSGQESFAGIDYTEIYTHDDEVVTPNADATGSSSLRPGPGRITNVATQDVCPLDSADHLLVGTTDAVAYALVMDALNHDGPADPKRIDTAAVCSQLISPGLDPAETTVASTSSAAALAQAFGAYPRVAAEPPLRCYVTASCPAGATAATPGPASSSSSKGARQCTSRRAFRVRIDLRGALRGAKVTLDGKRLSISRVKGARTVRVDLRGVKKTKAVLRIRGRTASGRTVTRTHRYATCTKRR